MTRIPTELESSLRRHGQEHVLRFWSELNDQERTALVEQLRQIDLDELTQLYSRREETYTVPPLSDLCPLPRQALTASQQAQERSLARAALEKGQVAYLVVAGGQGSRLGFENPKGMYSIGPVSERTLFHIHAQRILALRYRHKAPLPFLVMTSPATDEETRRYFAQEDYFGLPEEDVWFFQQGTMPALDWHTGKLLLESKSRLFLSPNGHGGTLTGLAQSGLLDRLRQRGVETIYYFQVDNPMVDLGDLSFLGRHLGEKAEVSAKAIVKQDPMDKVGNFVLHRDRLEIIEYSDLSEKLAQTKDASGQLFFWAGSPAIHLFDRGFLERLAQVGNSLPWHIAKKKVPFLDSDGKLVQPEENNALKFERFIFDVLPRAERWAVVSVRREDEFEPLKNASGPDSPQTVRQALVNQAALWLEQIGIKVPRDDQGRPAFPIEINPLFALDTEELARKLPATFRIDGPVLLT